jgi:hypothetical protein
MKSIFNYIFPKNTKSTFQKPYVQHSSLYNPDYVTKGSRTESELSFFDNIPMQNSYEVAEISFEEFKNTVKVERRKSPRKSNETRSVYTTKQ